MLKIAIAGTGGLAQLIAGYLQTDTSHQFVLLSRDDKPALRNRGLQVIVVDYSNISSLRYALSGIDTVVSTISGAAQLQLIDAAVANRVRRFAPSEFEGLPSLRSSIDPKNAALERLQHYSGQIEYTCFCCGVFYERFAPGGLAALGMGGSTLLSTEEGAFLLNIRQRSADLPYDTTGRPVYLCATSASDVARFVVRALDLPFWPEQLTMCGERTAVADLVTAGEMLKGGMEFQRRLHTPEALLALSTFHQSRGDYIAQLRIQGLMDVLEGRYDFNLAALNSMVDFIPISLSDWLHQAWATP